MHDLRNPLAVVLTNLEFVLSEVTVDGQIRDALEDALAAGQRIARQLKGGLEVDRLERGELRPRLTPVDIGGVLTMVADRYTLVARDAGVRVSIAAKPGLRALVDLDLIARVLQNVVDNAMRYTHSGGQICLQARAEDKGPVEIRIANDGEPIPAELRRTLLERPLAPEGTASMNRDLGLYFCRLAVEAHGGSMRVDETREFPVVVVIELPRTS